jgi:hypothetical protein
MIGVIFGVAEASAGYTSGFLAKYIRDDKLSMTMAIIGLLTCLSFHMMGGAKGGNLALGILLLECYCAGSLYNMVWLLIAARVPAEA